MEDFKKEGLKPKQIGHNRSIKVSEWKFSMKNSVARVKKDRGVGAVKIAKSTCVVIEKSEGKNNDSCKTKQYRWGRFKFSHRSIEFYLADRSSIRKIVTNPNKEERTNEIIMMSFLFGWKCVLGAIALSMI